MDSVALQGVYAPYVDTPSRHTDGRTGMTTTSTGEASTTMKRRHDGRTVRHENRDHEAADAVRRALQVALDRRDNGGSV